MSDCAHHYTTTTFYDGKLWQGMCDQCGAELEIDESEVGQ